MIFGHTEVLIEKDPTHLRWLVSTTTGQILLGVPWRLAFDQSEIGFAYADWRTGDVTFRPTNPDLFEAFKTCLTLAPLTPSDLQALERSHSGLTRGPMYRVDQASVAWQAQPAVPTTPRPASVPRLQDEPRRTQSRALVRSQQDAGFVPPPERKLLL